MIGRPDRLPIDGGALRRLAVLVAALEAYPPEQRQAAIDEALAVLAERDEPGAGGAEP